MADKTSKKTSVAADTISSFLIEEGWKVVSLKGGAQIGVDAPALPSPEKRIAKTKKRK